MLILIGSYAAKFHYSIERMPSDMDLIGSLDDFMSHIKSMYTRSDIVASYPIKNGKKWVVKAKKNNKLAIYECELLYDQTENEAVYLTNLRQLVNEILLDPNTTSFGPYLVPSHNCLYMLKMSHRYLKNSPHFLKTMSDIQNMRKNGAVIEPRYQQIYEERQAVTYDYAHPNLNVTKDEFFKS